MSDSFWKKLNIAFGFFTIGILFGFLVMTANVEIRDFDIWLHLGMGNFIVEHGYVPDQDILSCTVEGKFWNNHEWLFQVIAHYFFSTWGAQGLINMQVAVIWIMVLLLLFLGYNRDRQSLVVFMLLLVVLTYQSRFTIRPEMFSMLFFTVFIYVLSIYIDRRWAVPVLFISQALWVNLHGFFFLGPLFVIIAIVSEWIKRHVRLPYEWNKIGRLTKDEYGRLKLILVFVALACFINPQTVKGALYPLGILFDIKSGSGVFFAHIQELQKPIKWNNIFAYNNFIFYKLMILISAYSFIFNRRKIDISVLAFWLVFLGFSLVALRNVVFFAFAAYLVIITNSLTTDWERIIPFQFKHKKFAYITDILFKVVMILWMVNFGLGKSSIAYYDFDAFEYKTTTAGISKKQYPIGAVKFLVDNEIKGNMFNDFNSGAYLVGNVFPNLKVFIDGRTEVYGPEFFDVYLKIWRDGNMKLFEDVVTKQNITVALLNSALDPVPPPVFLYLHNSKDWVPVYFNDDGIVYLKDVPEHKETIEEFGMNLKEWQSEPIDLQRLGPQRVAPYPYINRAFSFESIGLYDQAYSEAIEANKINPEYVGPYKVLGQVYAQRGDYQKSFENFRIAAMYEPGSRENKFNLAQAYYDLEDFEGAARIYSGLIAMDSGKPKPYFLKARAQIKDAKYDDGLQTLQAGLVRSPQSVLEVIELGAVAEERGDWGDAVRIYKMAIGREKHQLEARLKLGKAYLALEKRDKALEVLEPALDLDPDNEEIFKAFKKAGGKISR